MDESSGANALEHVLRVTLVSGSAPDMPCGVGDYTDRLARALCDAGVVVTVVTSSDPRVRICESPSQVRISGGWSWWRAAHLLRAILKTRPDIVHVQYPTVGYRRGTAPLLLAALVRIFAPRTRMILTLHEFDRFSARHRYLVRVAARAAHLLVAPDRLQVRGLSSQAGWARPRIVEIPIAANIQPTQPRTGTEIRQPPDPDEPLLVGTWGFLRADKGIDTLLDAFDLVAAKRPSRLLFVGDPGPDAAYVEHVRRRVRSSACFPSVAFTGWQDEEDLSRTLLSLDVCALPFIDGLAANRGTYLGAVAHGLYVVTTSMKHTGYDPSSNTAFVAPGDVDGLARAVLDGAHRPRIPVRDVSDDWRTCAHAHVIAYTRSRSRSLSA